LPSAFRVPEPSPLAVLNLRSTAAVSTTYQDKFIAHSPPADKRPAAVADEGAGVRSEANQMVRALERAFGQSFSVVDCTAGHIIRPAQTGLAVDLHTRMSSCEEIAQRGRPEIVDEVSPLSVLAVPLPTAPTEPPLVAVSTFLTETVTEEAQIAAAAHEFGVDSHQALRWAQTQICWHPHAIQELSAAVAEKTAMQQTTGQLKRQLADLSAHLLTTFEEITLLHRLTEHLSISQTVTELCQLSVGWLADVIPARSVAIWFESNSHLHEQHVVEATGRKSILIVHGDCPLNEQEFGRFIERLGPKVANEPLVLNRGATSSPTWFYPHVREIISVPIREGNRVFGWLLALNHSSATEITNSEAEFGTVEACLMASVATILGIHCGNISLYHEQSEFFASVVRALTSAIDAKDPYTCGHSDRVARLSVCLARQLGCTTEELNTIYLSGLLHDIGKIGIDDNVLRKPGPLTHAELEHIKTHPELGCRILDGVKQLDKVLPIVRHHHEAWNGGGYPDGLSGEETPFLARVVAVADSIDAMSSDRPYRRGMTDEKLDSILRDGSGKQWDARVIEAVFQVRDDLRLIGKEERKPLSLDVAHWQAETEIVDQLAAV
jgi:HD-GYP domain-containing protein (c-di-GMP phosphodiesterase class II)